MIDQRPIERFKRYRARIQVRRGGQFVVRPESEGLDGREVVVEALWLIGGPMDNPLYEGEWAMRSDALRELGIMWIASGDLVDLEELPADPALN